MRENRDEIIISEVQAWERSVLQNTEFDEDIVLKHESVFKGQLKYKCALSRNSTKNQSEDS